MSLRKALLTASEKSFERKYFGSGVLLKLAGYQGIYEPSQYCTAFLPSATRFLPWNLRYIGIALEIYMQSALRGSLYPSLSAY